MAATRVLGIAELVQNILTRLHECDHGKDCELAPLRGDVKVFHQTHHDPSLVSCLRVDHLWFQTAKHILWANIPSIQLFSQIKRERRQIYANSVKSLQVCLPHIAYGKPQLDPTGNHTQAHLEIFRHLSFPKLQRLYVVAWPGAAPLSPFSSLPTTAQHLFIRFGYSEEDYLDQVEDIQDHRLDLEWIDTEGYDLITMNDPGQGHTLGPQLDTMVGHICKFDSLKGLSMIGYPECDEKVVWNCIMKTPQLQSLQALELNLSQSVHFDRLFPKPGRPFSSLKRLRVDRLALHNVPALLRHSRALEVVQLRIDHDDPNIDEQHLTKLWEALSQNENLSQLDVWFDPHYNGLSEASFALREKSLLLFSDRCKSLTRFAIYGLDGIKQEVDVNDGTLAEFSRNLPNMEVCILPFHFDKITHQSLLSFSKHWPQLKRLDVHTFMDFGQVAEHGFLMPNLEELQIGFPKVARHGRHEYCTSTWLRVLTDLCPKLGRLILQLGPSCTILYPPFSFFEIKSYLQGNFREFGLGSDEPSDDSDSYGHDMGWDPDDLPSEEVMEGVLGYLQNGVPEWEEYQYGRD